MEALNYSSSSDEQDIPIPTSPDTMPETTSLPFLSPIQKGIVTTALSSPHFISRFTEYDIVRTQNSQLPVPSHEAILFEELCFTELNKTARDNQTYLSPTASRGIFKDIAKKLRIFRAPIDSDGLFIERDGENSYLRGICEYTLSSDLENHKTAQMDRYLNKNNELDFLRTPESLEVFNKFLAKYTEDFPPHLILDIREIQPLLVLSYIATPNCSFPGVKTRYSSFPVSVVRKVAQSIEQELRKGKEMKHGELVIISSDSENIVSNQ